MVDAGGTVKKDAKFKVETDAREPQWVYIPQVASPQHPSPQHPSCTASPLPTPRQPIVVADVTNRDTHTHKNLITRKYGVTRAKNLITCKWSLVQ